MKDFIGTRMPLKPGSIIATPKHGLMRIIGPITLEEAQAICAFDGEPPIVPTPGEYLYEVEVLADAIGSVN